MPNVTLITLVAFVAVSGLFFLLASSAMKLMQDPVRRRLESGMTGVVPSRGSEFVDSLAAQLPQPVAAKTDLEHELRRAGYFKPTALNVFLALRNGAFLATVVATGLLVHFVGPGRQDVVVRVVIVGAAAAALAWSLPRLMVRAAGNRRVERISRGLPFALDMTVMCLTGGLTLREALRHVSQEIGAAHPDLATEFAIIQQQADLASMESAFRQFARRIDSPEVAAMVALIIQNEQLGTNIANSVRQYADAIRLKWRQMAEERASKTGVYMLFPLSFCLLPAVFLVLWGPAALDLMHFLRDVDTSIPALPELPSLQDTSLNR